MTDHDLSSSAGHDLSGRAGHDLSGRTALVTGASRGFGRATSSALAGAGARVIGVARSQDRLDDLRAELGGEFVAVCADVTDPTVAGQLVDAYRPDVLVLNAGASPLSRPIHLHTWQTFSRTWEVDVQHVFHWTREALLRPLRPGSVVFAMSSGAALGGSPISGGYAGAKAAVRFLTGYAAQESQRAGLGIRFSALLPSLTPGTALSDTALSGYAERQGVELGKFLAGLGPVLTPGQVAAAVVRLAGDPALAAAAYRLSPDGLAAVDG